MIALQHRRDPDIVPVGFHGNGKQENARRLLKAKLQDTLHKLYKQAPWKATKPSLKGESYDKCAYCEMSLVSQHGDVEHFRPKSTWWWLALCYDNFLPSCQICNQTYKSNRFPLREGGLPVEAPSLNSENEIDYLLDRIAPDPIAVDQDKTLAAYLDECLVEGALLPNPYQENPEDLFAYEEYAERSGIPGQVKIVPKQPEFGIRIKACEEVLGLNREKLCECRYKVMKPLKVVYQLWIAAQDPRTQDELAEMLHDAMAPSMQFAGMARYFIREKWRLLL